jgi:hypothetical protein
MNALDRRAPDRSRYVFAQVIDECSTVRVDRPTAPKAHRALNGHGVNLVAVAQPDQIPIEIDRRAELGHVDVDDQKVSALANGDLAGHSAEPNGVRALEDRMARRRIPNANRIRQVAWAH